MVTWRTTLNGANTRERLALIAAEEMACLDAVTLDVNERCAEHPIGLADCSDIRVRKSSLLWARSKRNLLVAVEVDLDPSGRTIEFYWRINWRMQRKIAADRFEKMGL